MGAWKALGGAILVLVLLGVGADIGFQTVAEARIARELQRRLDLPDRPDVELEGFPFFLHLARRKFDAVLIESGGLGAGGLRVDRVKVRLEEVRFASLEALSGGRGKVSAERGSGTAEVTETALGDFLAQQDVPAQVELIGPTARLTTTVSVGAFETEVRAEGTVAVVNGMLEFRPTDVQAGGLEIDPELLAVRVELPETLPGLVYDGVTVERGVLRLSFRVDGSVLRAR